MVLDYNKHLNIIASGTTDAMKLWNANDRQKNIEQYSQQSRL